MHSENSFITLTYANEPENKSINVEDFQKFMKRLRKTTGKKIRFFHCGEYGKVLGEDGLTPLPHPFVGGREALGRPHYHALLFGLDFEDKEIHSVKQGTYLYKSEELRDIWGHGHVTIGEVTRQSAAYVARYVMKKINGELQEEYYKKVDENGVVYDVKPEYTTMSRRPGIGATWYEQFKGDIFPYDECVTEDGRKVPVPKYYSKLYRAESEDKYELVRRRRVKRALKRKADNTPERLETKERVLISKISKLKRGLNE